MKPKSSILILISASGLTQLKKRPTKIDQKNDTLFDGKQCLIEKKMMMPVYFKEVGAGASFKEGLPLGRLHFFNEKRFLDLKINMSIIDATFKIAGFHKPNASMLVMVQIDALLKP